ncbi:hypothetical protein [Actinocorallia lasiicapitis]
MSRQGFAYTKLPSGSADENPVLASLETRYGPQLATAKISGYGAEQRVSDDDRPGDGRPSSTKGLSPEKKAQWGIAFFGPENAPQAKVTTADGAIHEFSTQGCLAESRIKIFGSIEKFGTRGNGAVAVTTAAIKRATTDPLMTTLNEKWAACMGKKGLESELLIPEAKQKGGQKPSPESAWDAGKAYYRTLGKAEARRKEIKLATADAECEQSTGYLTQRRELEDKYFTVSLKLFESQVTAIQEVTDDSLTRAKGLLAGGG